MSETQEYIVEEWLSVKYQIKINASSRIEAEKKYLENDYDCNTDREKVDSNIDDFDVSLNNG
jgi:hypothetical protein